MLVAIISIYWIAGTTDIVQLYELGIDWKYQNFKGTKWQNINKDVDKEYLKNTYRVLLTRARQGMVIFIPESSNLDHTRPSEFYDRTFEYLKKIGIKEIE